jgi:Ni/Co efflux regulator RcnB
MRRIVVSAGIALGLLAMTLLAAGPAAAGKPSWAGGGKEDRASQDASRGKEKKKDRSEHLERRSPGRDTVVVNFFVGRDRGPIDRYYGERFRTGNCPPGLAKKGNRCLPPGQAKKWARNKPLPRGVIFYDLPNEVVVHLGPPPAGHRFVRVAQDILLIAVGTGMVVDAIEDIGNEMGR